MTNIAPSKPLCADHRRVWNQIWMIMRLTIVLIIISTFTLSAKSYSQKVDLFLKNSPIETAFEQIRQQTGYSFFWKEQTLESLSSITVSLHKASLQEAVKACLKDLPLTFKIQGNIVYIERSEVTPLQADPNTKTRFFALPTITGKVTDAKGIPLPAYPLLSKEQSRGLLQTPTEDSFCQMLPRMQSSGLFYWMKPEEVSIAGKEIINVSMTKESVGLDEIVAIGYATRAKEQ